MEVKFRYIGSPGVNDAGPPFLFPPVSSSLSIHQLCCYPIIQRNSHRRNYSLLYVFLIIHFFNIGRNSFLSYRLHEQYNCQHRSTTVCFVNRIEHQSNGDVLIICSNSPGKSLYNIPSFKVALQPFRKFNAINISA